MAKRDYYEVLGVSKNASDDEIKKELHGKFMTPESLALAKHLIIQKEEDKLY